MAAASLGPAPSSDFGCVPFIRQAKGTNESASDHSLFAIALVWPIHVIPSAGSANASESPLLGCDGVRTGLGVYGTVILTCLVVGDRLESSVAADVRQ